MMNNIIVVHVVKDRGWKTYLQTIVVTTTVKDVQINFSIVSFHFNVKFKIVMVKLK